MVAADEFRRRYGPVAVVTGASSGIGEAMARDLADRGLAVVLCARRAERLAALADELQAAGTAARVVPADLATPEGVRALLSAVADDDVGLLVSNAGFGLKGYHHEQDEARLEAMLALNSRAPMLLTRAVAERLVRRGRGGIVLTSSIEGFFGYPFSAAYAGTKAFTMALGEGLWGELTPRGVDVLVVAPGTTRTEAVTAQGIDIDLLPGVMSPAAVARQALDQLGHRPVTVTGAANRAAMAAVRLVPRRARLRLLGAGMRRTLERSGWAPAGDAHGR